MKTKKSCFREPRYKPFYYNISAKPNTNTFIYLYNMQCLRLLEKERQRVRMNEIIMPAYDESEWLDT